MLWARLMIPFSASVLSCGVCLFKLLPCSIVAESRNVVLQGCCSSLRFALVLLCCVVGWGLRVGAPEDRYQARVALALCKVTKSMSCARPHIECVS